MPLLWLFGIALVLTPVAVVYLLVRVRTLRELLAGEAEETTRRHSALQHEIASLRSQLATLQAAQSPDTRETEPLLPATPKATVDTKSEPAAVTPDPGSEPRQMPSPVAIPPAPVVPPKPTISLTPKAAKPSAPTEVPGGGEKKPELPPKPASPPPAQPVVPPPAHSVGRGTTTAPQAPAAGVQLPTAARISVEATSAALRVAAPQKPSVQQRMKKVWSLEETLGTNWLNKLGIIILVLGVALFGIYELQALGALGKVAISYAASAALLAGGIYLEKREDFRLLGRTGIGGGWALLFFSTYAMHHVAAMQVIGSETLDLALMLLVAFAMTVNTLRYRSQLVTGLAFLLGYTTAALSHDNVYSLSAGVVLAIGLVAIVIKMGWFELEVFGILSSYLNHLYWLYRILGSGGAQGRAFPEYHASLAMLLFYWLVFRVSYVVRRIRSESDERISTVAGLLNTLLLLAAMKFQSVQPQLAWIALLVIGLMEVGCAQVPRVKARREAFVMLSVLGAALVVTAVPFHYSGNNVAVLWLVAAEVFLVAGIVGKEIVFRRVGLATGLLVGVHLAVIDFPPLMRLRAASETLELSTGIIFGLVAMTLYANTVILQRRWPELFSAEVDAWFVVLQSYLGAFAGASAIWALLGNDWTAVGFASTMLILAALNRWRTSIHFQAQQALLGVVTLYRALTVNLHVEAAGQVHVAMRLLTLPILAGLFYAAAKVTRVEHETERWPIRDYFGWAGSVLVGLLIWFEAPELWQPIAFIALGVSLVEVGRAVGYRALAGHAHVAGAAAIITAVIADQGNTHKWHTIPMHAVVALPVVAGCYLLAKRVEFAGTGYLNVKRAAYSWAATGLLAWALEEALRTPWVSVGWIALAVSLALVGRRLRYAQLAWQANAVALFAFVRTLFFNYPLEERLAYEIPVRIVTVTLVAAGLYLLSRRSAPEERFAGPIAFVHSFGATGLLALLAWYEEPNAWLAAIWAVFALVLALIDRRWKLDELRWQAHVLALLALGRGLVVNLDSVETWRNISVRLISLAIVAVVLYAMSRIVRIPEEWRERQFQHAYSWCASVVVSLLLWYELQPLSVAVGWAVFGLVLFQYGLLRKIVQFRYQAYVALCAAFARIFFANLTAGETGTWGPRVYTIAPVALILFFVYGQLPEKDEEVATDRLLHFDVIIGYLGTATVAALCYFQFHEEWVVTAWSAVVFALFGLAVILRREIFLQQGLVLTVAALTRGMAHNLFGAGYFGEGDWQGRYVVLGSAVAILMATLPFAFQLRRREAISVEPRRLARVVAWVMRRPEQVQFFAPIVLLTFMLALKMRAGMVTMAWGIEGVAVVLLALAVKERSFRLTGLMILLLCVGKVMALDAWGLQPRDRYLTFIIVGASLLVVSYLYSKHRETIRQFL